MRGSVVKRGKSYSVVLDLPRGADGKRKQKWISAGSTKREADRKLSEVMDTAHNGTLVEPSRETVSQFMSRWLETEVRHTRRSKTYKSYDMISRLYMQPPIGGVRMQNVKPSHVQSVIAGVLDKGLSPTTARRTWATMHVAFKAAVQWDLIRRNPCDNLKPPKQAHHEIIPPSKAEVLRLLESAEALPYYAPFHLLAYTGARRGEICGIRREDIDLESGTLSITNTVGRQDGTLVIQPTKSATSRRMVHLGLSSINVIRQHLARQAEERLRLGSTYTDRGMLFTSPTGRLLDPDLLSKNWKRLCDKERVTYRLHDLRHFHATALIAAGVHIKAIQGRLGHSSPSLTMAIYAHLTPQMDKDAALMFESAMA